MITINMDKAKNIAHRIRRQSRQKEFQPYDEIIAKQIPGSSAVEAEQARQLIRDKYQEIQLQIEQSTEADGLLAIVNSIKQA